MKLVMQIALGIILALVLLVAGCGALLSSSTDTSTDSPDVEHVSSADVSDSDDGFVNETAGQENARRQAESYIDSSGFSRSGLIKQLKYEGYSLADATYAVDAIDVDWNEQAARSAESYLDSSAFSRSGLIHQLKYEGYSQQEAVYGVNSAGL